MDHVKKRPHLTLLIAHNISVLVALPIFMFGLRLVTPATWFLVIAPAILLVQAYCVYSAKYRNLLPLPTMFSSWPSSIFHLAISVPFFAAFVWGMALFYSAAFAAVGYGIVGLGIWLIHTW